MVSKLRSWWQYIRKHWIVAIIIVFVVLMALIFIGYRSDWTGFNGYTQVTTAYTTKGPSAGTVVRTEVNQPGKALWDWMQLLIIPVVLAVGGFWLNQIQKSREEYATDQRAQVERGIARDARREAALPDYIDKMSELLFEKNLRRSQSGDEVRIIARVRTLTVLRELDADRKGSLLRFLYEACLINKDVKEGILNLTRADLSAANLSGVDLSRASLIGADLGVADLYGANLSNADLRGTNFGEAIMIGANVSGADLRGADLSIADLSGADLRGAFLSEANLRAANLSGANLKGTTGITNDELEKQAKSLAGATMPDGSKHP